MKSWFDHFVWDTFADGFAHDGIGRELLAEVVIPVGDVEVGQKLGSVIGFGCRHVGLGALNCYVVDAESAVCQSVWIMLWVFDPCQAATIELEVPSRC